MSAESEDDRFMELLSPDPVLAAAAYQKLRNRLLFYFRQNGSPDAADAADEVICRVVRRIHEGVVISPGLTGYCYGVACMVLKEQRGKIGRQHPSLEETGEPPPRQQAGLSKLENSLYLNEGLNSIPADDRVLWMEYHQGDRNALAGNLNMSPNALRIKISRIKAQLRKFMSPGFRKKE